MRLRLVLFGITLHFAEERRVYTLGQRVYEAITGEIPSKPEPEYTEGIKLRHEDKKLRVMWNPFLGLVALEGEFDVDKGIEIILTILEQIRTAVPIYKLDEKRVTTYWILPTLNYDFPSLERKYRETMIAQNQISGLAYDSSTVFDIKVGEWTLHHQSGAMWPQQLGTYLAFKADDIPEAFLFLEVSIIDKKVVEYSSEEIRNYLRKAFNYCKSHSTAFQQIWEEIL